MGEDKFSDELNGLLNFIENKLVKEFPTLVINMNYLMLGVFDYKNTNIHKIFKWYFQSTKFSLLNGAFYDIVSKSSLTAIRPDRKLSYDNELKNLLDKANDERENLGDGKIGTEHLFLAILNKEYGDNKVQSILIEAGLTYDRLKKKILSDKEDGKPQNNEKQTPEKKLLSTIVGDYEPFKFKEYNSSIEQYCINITNKAINGEIDTMIGREEETQSLIRVLGRKKKRNVILVGDGGCGKTTIAENIANLIYKGDCPLFLMDKIVVSLNYTSLISGTMYRGMLEERVDELIKELRKNKNYILIIDNIDSVFSSRNGNNDGFGFSSMFSDVMDDGDLLVIGTCNFNGYRNVFEKNSSLSRKFQKIVINPSSTTQTYDIIKGILPSYEKHHNLKIDETAIETIVKLSEKYITDRKLPDSAIDILDEICSYSSIKNENKELKEILLKINSVSQDIHKLRKKDQYDEADDLNDEKRKLQQRANEIRKETQNKKTTIYKDDIYLIVSQKTGIPITKLGIDEKEWISNINERIKKNVIGQDHAVDSICRSIKRNRIGIRNGKNYGTFLLIGKTGTGKTLLAKNIAKEVFGDESALIRFDMSEYSDKSSVNKLIGANPGFIGYEEGGRLTEAVKNKKYCVILFDEIEKADSSIYNLFLQVFDDGILTDSSGQRIDFKNTILIMTSNVGVKEATEHKSIGFIDNTEEKEKQILFSELKNTFQPEFLNRIDDIIYFQTLSKENLKQIVRLEMNKVKCKLIEIGYDLEYDDNIVDYILNLIDKEKEYGARPIIRAIQKEIEDKITDYILDDEDSNGSELMVKVQDKKVIVQKK